MDGKLPTFETRYLQKKVFGNGLILAQDTLLKRRLVVLKPQEGVIYPDISHEAITYARIGYHPNILGLYDVQYSETGKSFLILEWLDPEKGWYDLGTVVDIYRRRKERFPVEFFLKILQQLCVGLQYIHYNNIIHQDIKPQNILFRIPRPDDYLPQYQPYHLKIIDFGIATEKGRRRQSGWTIGYASPEQINQQKVDFNSDIFSLGVVMYELLTLRLPYINSDTSFRLSLDRIHSPVQISKFRPDIHPGIAEILHRCLALQSERRYTTIDQVIEAINLIVMEASQEKSATINLAKQIRDLFGGVSR